MEPVLPLTPSIWWEGRRRKGRNCPVAPASPEVSDGTLGFPVRARGGTLGVTVTLLAPLPGTKPQGGSSRESTTGLELGMGSSC